MIAIIGAMAEEIEALTAAMADVRKQRIGPLEAATGRLEGERVAVVRSGVGKVNAAMTAQALIDRLAPQALLMIGVAGAVDPALEIGDVVIAEDALEYDVDATALGFAPGEIPFDPVSVFPADAALRTRAVRAAQALFDRAPIVGRVLSGDRFIADRGAASALRERFSGTCVEMEGAAVAHVAYKNGVPFCLIRTISDRADGEAPRDFPAFLKEAAARGAALICEMLRRA
ncbi:MAG: 5'-methylthioadenosine/adenosylhomocysteine nucleosidase [Hydrogenibacillus sp.]|nr:5'-methylthioadenosine/adenosylhomocysteine nucleosidase [Hydrogenibacillus sp.]